MLRADIQGLRAIAVIGVIIFHLNSTWLPGGYLGVDVFFVISGYLISKIIINSETNFSWVGFYGSRIRRIVPAYALMLLVVSLASAVLLIPTDFAAFDESLHSAFLFTSNSYFASAGDYFSSAAHEWPLLHTWSLAVEVQFYLLLPIALRLIPQKLLPVAIGCLLVFGLTLAQWVWISLDNSDLYYYSTFIRAPEFLFGTWLASISQNGQHPSLIISRLLSFLGAILIIGSMAFLDRSKFSPLTAAIPCLGAAFVIATNNVPTISGWLSIKALVTIGTLSYSLYLWHWPFIALSRYILGDADFTASQLALITGVFSSVSYLSWRFVEQPLISSLHLLSKFKLGILSVLACSPIFAASPINAGLTPSSSAETLRYAPPESICHGTVDPRCTKGDPRQLPTVLVIGDSHAAQLNLFMDKLGKEYGISSVVMSASSCMPLAGLVDSRLESWAVAPCKEMQAAVSKELPHFDKLIIAGKWSYHWGNPLFQDFFRRFLLSDNVEGKKIFVLPQVPMLKRHPIRSKRLSYFGIGLSPNATNLATSANGQMKSTLAGIPNTVFFDFSELQLFASPPFFNGEIFYMDTHHLNEIGSVLYAEEIGPSLAAALKTAPVRDSQ